MVNRGGPKRGHGRHCFQHHWLSQWSSTTDIRLPRATVQPDLLDFMPLDSAPTLQPPESGPPLPAAEAEAVSVPAVPPGPPPAEQLSLLKSWVFLLPQNLPLGQSPKLT